MNKNQKGFSVIESLLILVIVVIIGSLGVYVYKQNKTSETQESNISPKSVTELQETISKITAKVREDQPTVKVHGKGSIGGGPISILVKGYDFQTVVRSTDSVTFSRANSEVEKLTSILNDPQYETQYDVAAQKDKEAMKPTADLAIKFMSANGYTEVKDYVSATFAYQEGRIYESKNNVCAIRTEETIAIECINRQALEAEAKEVEPFVKEYRKAGEVEGPDTAFGEVGFGTGATANDKYANIASLSNGVSSTYFYLDNGKWIYFPTEDYETECRKDLAKNPKANAALSWVCENKDGL